MTKKNFVVDSQAKCFGCKTAADYGLDGTGSNPSGDEILRPSRPALGPTQPPVQWVPGLSPGVKCGRGVLLATHPLLVPLSWKSRAISLGHTGPVTGSLYLYLYVVFLDGNKYHFIITTQRDGSY